MERWVPANGFAGRYEVSDLGRVRSVPRQVVNGGKVKVLPGRLLKPYLHRRHLKVTLYGDSRSERQVFVHILVLESFVGPKPAGQLVRHLDDDYRNNTLQNLKFGSPSENSHDAVRNGVHPESKRTTCDYGHPLDGYAQSKKSRYCRRCNREKQRKAKAMTQLMSRQSPGAGIVKNTTEGNKK